MVVNAWREGQFDNLVPSVIIVNTKNAGIIRKIEEQKWNIPYYIVSSKNETYAQNLLGILAHHCIDIVSQNGWLAYTPNEVTAHMAGRIGNQHPGQIPHFGGHKMYGTAVPCAHDIFNRLTGVNYPAYATYHHTVAGFDTGDIISIKKMQLPHYDHVWTIAELTNEQNMLRQAAQEIHGQLLPLEHQNVLDVMRYVDHHGAFPQPIQSYKPLPGRYQQQIQEAKQLAITIFQQKK